MHFKINQLISVVTDGVITLKEATLFLKEKVAQKNALDIRYTYFVTKNKFGIYYIRIPNATLKKGCKKFEISITYYHSIVMQYMHTYLGGTYDDVPSTEEGKLKLNKNIENINTTYFLTRAQNGKIYMVSNNMYPIYPTSMMMDVYSPNNINNNDGIHQTK